MQNKRVETLFLLTLVGCVLWGSGCGFAAPQPVSLALSISEAKPRVYKVVIKNFKFDPEVLVVAPGDTVTWENRDIVPHTATSISKAFDSRNIAVDKSWSFTTPQKIGDYLYSCTLHPNMKAKVTVR